MNDPGDGYLGALIRGEQERGGATVRSIRHRLGLPDLIEPKARTRTADPTRKAKRKAAKAARKRNRR